MPITREQALKEELRRRELIRELERRRLAAPPTTIAPEPPRMPPAAITPAEGVIPPRKKPFREKTPRELMEEQREFHRRMLRFGAKGLWKGLGVVTVPFERIERAIATPLTRPAEKRVRFMPPVEPGRELSFGEKARRLFGGAPSLESAKAEWKEAWPATKAGLKALVPWRGMAPPEETRDFRDLVSVLKEIESGREPPELYKDIYGTALSVAVTPKVLAGGLKAIGKVARVTKIPQKIRAARIPEWQIGRLKARAELGARTEKAIELAKPLG